MGHAAGVGEHAVRRNGTFRDNVFPVGGGSRRLPRTDANRLTPSAAVAPHTLTRTGSAAQLGPSPRLTSRSGGEVVRMASRGAASAQVPQVRGRTSGQSVGSAAVVVTEVTPCATARNHRSVVFVDAHGSAEVTASRWLR